uniref:Uncharacterized protein n=1 Tax=Rhodosorus marinus TaxID=101924 RepID=A0A6T6LRN5_9RHOD|mmetsp:Transcript_18947/g.27432  ORF Transcript_18947/g.27432 Transcript_18947/m.27432 type:complete len:259 (+) Transcript_18947:229-1005(+)
MAAAALKRGTYFLGHMLRETGQALERMGARSMGQFYCAEPLDRHRQIMNLLFKSPIVSSNVFLAPCASLVGSVSVGSGSSVWYGATIRGDDAPVLIGEETNIQDGVAVFAKNMDRKYQNVPIPTIIGDRVTIGHGAVVNNAVLENECLIGMGVVIGVGSKICSNSIVAAGSVVPTFATVPSGELWAGVPAVFKKKLSEAEIKSIKTRAGDYQKLAKEHLDDIRRTPEQIRAETLGDSRMAYDEELKAALREHRPEAST